jgi:hypothetical protein
MRRMLHALGWHWTYETVIGRQRWRECRLCKTSWPLT